MKAVIICDWSFRFCRTNSLHNTRHQGQNYELLKNYLYFKAHLILGLLYVLGFYFKVTLTLFLG